MQSHESIAREPADLDLVQQTRRGNLNAYDAIIQRYQQSLANSLFHLCRNRSDLEDLVQETFIRAFRKLDRWEPSGGLLPWLRRIGYNLACDALRKQKRNPVLLETNPKSVQPGEPAEDHFQHVADRSQPQADVEERNDWLQWLLAHLDAEEMLLVTLLYLEALPVSEVANRTGWGISNVKVKTHRIRKKLKNIGIRHDETT